MPIDMECANETCKSGAWLSGRHKSLAVQKAEKEEELKRKAYWAEIEEKRMLEHKKNEAERRVAYIKRVMNEDKSRVERYEQELKDALLKLGDL